MKEKLEPCLWDTCVCWNEEEHRQRNDAVNNQEKEHMTNIKLPTAKRTNIVNVRIRSNKKVLLGKEFIVKSVELKDGEVIIKYTYKK